VHIGQNIHLVLWTGISDDDLEKESSWASGRG
jgi:hypothetical protein